MEFCKAPVHFIIALSQHGHSKPLALFLSLKKMYSSGHIWDFRKVDTKKLGFPVSKKTYYKYLRELQRLRLVDGDNVLFKRGKDIGRKGMVLAGQATILKLYPHFKPKYIYLGNDKDLRDSIEKVALSSTIERQHHKMKEPTVHNAYSTVLTKVGKSWIDSYENLRYTTSVSCKVLANKLGFKSAMTGWRREKRWKDDGFIKTARRLILVGYTYQENCMQVLRSHPLNFRIGDKILRPVANEIQIQNPKFGIKKSKTCYFDLF